MRRILLAAFALLCLASAAASQQVPGPNNSVGLIGRDTGTGLPCYVGGSATCAIPGGGGSSSGVASPNVASVPFTQLGNTVGVAASTTSAAQALTGSPNTVRVYNSAAALAYANLANSSGCTAAATNVPIAPGGSADLSVGANTYVCVILASGTGTVYETPGKTAFDTELAAVQAPLAAQAGKGVDIGQIEMTATGATSNNGSTTITTGNTFQTLLASNAARKGCLIQNPADATETLYVSVGIATGSATKAKSYQLTPGSAFSCSVGGGYVVTDNIAVTAVTSAHAFVEADQ